MDRQIILGEGVMREALRLTKAVMFVLACALSLSLLAGSAAHASNPIWLLSDIAPHELTDVDLAVLIRDLHLAVLEDHKSQAQALEEALAEAIRALNGTQDAAGATPDLKANLSANVTLAFRNMDAVLGDIQTLEVTVQKYNYAIEILNFFAD